MTAYYNEIEPFAAQWLRNLIAAGHIAPGEVDTRSVEDVAPDDLRGFTQCHFFAGIGLWSLALRWAGWDDSREVWTGSCPCQPFSAAGKGAGVADERHLWPAFFHLISECRPPAVFGEQVASKAGLGWFDLVSADLEGAGYAVGAADMCAAGVGAPHIRQRLWWGAERVEHAEIDGRQQRRAEPGERGALGGCVDVGLADRTGAGLEGHAGHGDDGGQPGRERTDSAGSASARRLAGRLADAGQQRNELGRDAGNVGRAPDQEQGQAQERQRGRDADSDGGADGRPRPPHVDWRDADWLFCRDGKWRPVEPGTFPLAHGYPARVGVLRAYGNAIVPQVAATFIEAWLDAKNDAQLVGF